MAQNKFNIGKILKAVKKSLNVDIPSIIAKDTKQYFQDNFKKQGFDSGTIEKWQPRKSKKWKHPILLKTGALKKSIHIRQRNSRRISLVSDLPYSRIHNEGLNGLAWGKYPFKMPKRQYMGHSPALEKMQLDKIINVLNDCWYK
jgi:phage gpG-like protein